MTKLSFLADTTALKQRQQWVEKQRQLQTDKSALRELTLAVCRDRNMQEQRVFWDDIKRGYAYPGENKIKMPTWVLDRQDIFQRVYLLHELAHQLQYHRIGKMTGHDKPFMLVETELCRRYAKVIPLYSRKRGYCFAYMAIDGHAVVCDSYGHSPYSDLFSLTVGD